MSQYLTGSDTRSRLLEAAAEEFAEKGYRHAKVQDICQRARANAAAVNYHFRDKEQLYIEVINLALTDPDYPNLLQVELNPEDPPEMRLHQFIHALLTGILGTGRPAWHGKLIANEIANPTPALDFMVESFIRPLTERVDALVAELLGAEPNQEQVRLCATSIIGQCFTYHSSREIIIRLNTNLRLDTQDIERLAKHITEFSLAGLKAVALSAANKIEQMEDV